MTGAVGTDPGAAGVAVTGAAGPVRRRRGRLRVAVVVMVVLAGVGILAASGLQRSLVFYRTPTELMRDPGLVDARVRLGGLVQPGTLSRGDGVASFRITDGVTAVPVVFTGKLVGVFRDGQNALVEGRLGPGGVFRGDVLMVKHSDSYRAPDGRPYQPPQVGTPPR